MPTRLNNMTHPSGPWGVHPGAAMLLGEHAVTYGVSPIGVGKQLPLHPGFNAVPGLVHGLDATAAVVNQSSATALPVTRGYLHQGEEELKGFVTARKDAISGLLQAGAYLASNAITQGEAQRFAGTEHAPQHLKEAQAHALALQDGIQGSVAALGQGVHGWLDMAYEALRPSQLAWDRMLETFKIAELHPTEENLFAVGQSAAVFTGALAGILLPNGKKVPSTYMVDDVIWPQQGTQVTTYRYKSWVFKKVHSEVRYDDLLSGKPSVLKLAPDEVDALGFHLGKFQNLIASAQKGGESPKLEYLNDGWLKQPFVDHMGVYRMRPDQRELFAEDQTRLVNEARKFLRDLQPTSEVSGFMQFGDWWVRPDIVESNFRFPPPGKTQWVDNAAVHSDDVFRKIMGIRPRHR